MSHRYETKGERLLFPKADVRSPQKTLKLRSANGQKRSFTPDKKKPRRSGVVKVDYLIRSLDARNRPRFGEFQTYKTGLHVPKFCPLTPQFCLLALIHLIFFLQLV